MSTLYLSATAILLVIVLYLLSEIRGWIRDARLSPRILLFVIGWLAIVGAAASADFFSDFTAQPPRLPLVIGVPMITVLIIVFFAKRGSWIDEIHISKLARFQTFRFVLEIALWMLYKDHLMPREMTFEGMNFDIITGITAPFIALQMLQRNSKALAIAWNIMGLILVMNITVVALSATPVLHLLITDPPNTLPAFFPWVWLPAFLVPMAYLGHLLSLRKLMR